MSEFLTRDRLANLANLSPDRTVLCMGAGKAALGLHGPIWRECGYSQIAFDTNPDITSGAHLSEPSLEGVLILVQDLRALKDSGLRPAIVDIATSSGHHLEALKQVLEEVYLPSRDYPKGILIEKPLVSAGNEMDAFDAFMEAHPELSRRTIVNETYLASRALLRVLGIINEKREQGIDPVGVDIVKYKNRLPDVANGRFTDPVLGAYGIEMPHMVSLANVLSGNDQGEVAESSLPIANRYYFNIQGKAGSEATYVERLAPSGMSVRMAQGLGPFTISAGGVMEPNSNPGIVRYTTVKFSDGTSARIDFDPAPGVKRYHSIVSTLDPEGVPSKTEVIPDNMLRDVISLVIETVDTGKKPDRANLLSIAVARNTVLDLGELRRTAEIIDDAIACQSLSR